MNKKWISACAAAALLVSTAACSAPETEESAQPSASASATQSETLTGQGQGFGGVITATLTVEDGVITAVSFDAPDETAEIGGAALEELAEQVVAANGAEIDGVSGATYTSDGCRAAVLNALDPEANPFEADGGDEGGETASYPTGAEPVEIPSDRKIVSATTYGIYTKDVTSAQDCVIKATLYWDLDNNQAYAVQFYEPMLPWDDNGAAGGWGNMTDEAVISALGEDAIITFTAGETECNFAKYIQIGDVVWTGELGSDPACEVAVVYSADIDGQTVKMNDYVATEAGGKWYVDASAQPAYILKSAQSVTGADDENVAMTYQIEAKETNGHGTDFWPSPITFPGNMQAIKDFVLENGFDYDYYADGGMTQNDEGYWQTPDAVSGATLAETPTYLDMLKTLYERIQNGEYVEEN